jgi:riboflavin biosynthesis pyrimidine reductase
VDLLYENADLPRFDLPSALTDEYAGTIGFRRPCAFANFVTSLDGVAAIPDVDRSSALIGAGDPGDRFVMGLLRACADVVLIGAGTLRAHPTSRWTPENTAKAFATSFEQLRQTLGLALRPALAIVTASGKIDPSHPGLSDGAVLITTDEGAARLRENGAPESWDIAVVGSGDGVDPLAVVQALHSRGHDLILAEGGPTLLGELLRAHLVDELFLTISSRIAGRSEARPRPGIVDGVEFLPGQKEDATLLSARRSGSHLLLRYALETAARA